MTPPFPSIHDFSPASVKKKAEGKGSLLPFRNHLVDRNGRGGQKPELHPRLSDGRCGA